MNTSTKEVTRPFVSEKVNPAAIKVHKDGRLFICYLGDFKTTGGIFSTTEEGEQFEEIVSELSTEYCIDDMVFDSKVVSTSLISEDTQQIL